MMRLLLGIDPGFRKIGICFLTKSGLEFKYIEFSNTITDYAYIYQKLFDELWYVQSADFIFIEDVIFLPKRKREVQAMLFGTIAIILIRINQVAGYYFVSPWKVKKAKAEKIDELLENAEGKEHLIDAFKVLSVGLSELEKVPEWCLETIEKKNVLKVDKVCFK